jgi:hypothetical protein
MKKSNSRFFFSNYENSAKQQPSVWSIFKAKKNFKDIYWEIGLNPFSSLANTQEVWKIQKQIVFFWFQCLTTQHGLLIKEAKCKLY